MTPDPSAWGIDHGYQDAAGIWRDAPAATIDAIIEAMGATTAAPASVDDLWVVRAGDSVHVGGRGRIETEDGRTIDIDGAVSNLPLGYHWLTTGGRTIRLIVSPGRCHLRPALSAWGWAVQLYATRSSRSWGIGDLVDLRSLAEWSAGHGARIIMVSPLHSPTPAKPVQPSPYYPSSRCFRSVLHLGVDAIAGLAGHADAAALIAAGESLNDDRHIDRDRVLDVKIGALESVWATTKPPAAFEAFAEQQGVGLTRWGQFCTLAEIHGRSWRDWPDALQRSSSVAVTEACPHDRVRFHMWIQWLIDEQLAAASAAVDVVHDLAVGVDPGGADAWIWQDTFVDGFSIGAPPDEYNAAGQTWGLPPIDPWRLRQDHFEPFIQTVRAGLRHAGGLRIDHVMGLFRLFWVPEGGDPSEGTYVRYPWEEMLDIVALESQRAGAFIVGEDLGTVEAWVRDVMAERNVLSYRLLWFEPEPPRLFPERSLGAITTHDLPTVAGMWTGADVSAQLQRGMAANIDAAAVLRERMKAWTGLVDEAPIDQVVLGTYRLLASAPSALLAATLEDALEVVDRPNYPGTVGGTNWSVALPAPIETIVNHPGVAAVADVLNSR